MRLVLVGTSHHHAPVELRERVALDREQAAELAVRLGEAVCLSTCNRTELYVVAEDADDAERRAVDALAELEPEVEQALYRLRDQAAAHHLFRVAAGLDSLVPGEGEILGQVRAAYEAGTPGPLLERVFRQALHAGRKVRAQTAIGESPASVSAAAAAQQSLEEVAADTLRSAILASQPFVGLTDLLGVCWALGIPVVHLRIFPLPAKHMSAMCVRVADRSAILLGKDADYPPWSAYYLAHELGHIASGHIGPGTGALVDMGNLLVTKATDEEEIAADRFALQLLTGQPEPQVFTETRSFTAAELARVVLDTGPKVGIEPGTLALCFGYSTGNWAHATAALKWIYDRPEPVWTKVNALAAASLDWAALGDDAASFLRAVMSAAPNDTRGR